MKNTKELNSLDIAGLNKELLEISKKHLTLKFSKNKEALKYRRQIARIKTVINTK